MKNTNKKISPLAALKRQPRYLEFVRDSQMRLNFGLEVYRRRQELGLSQQALAKKIFSSQKVISNIERGDVDLKSSTINRLNGVLNFSAIHWARIFNFSLPPLKMIISQPSAADSNRLPLARTRQQLNSVNLSNVIN